MKNFSNLEKKIDIKFNNIDLLCQAMVHRSYLNENPNFHLDHNERLEFLGDAVLELIVTDYLYKKCFKSEGELTNFRAALVNSEMLSKKAKLLGLEEYLMMSRGETKDTGKARQFILENAFEALVGAIYLDQGYEKTANFVKKNILVELPKILKQKLYRDPKSSFQEESQDKMGITPTYEVLKEWGPDHNKHFVIGVFLEKELIGKGEGLSKQEAQRKAAEDALRNKGWRN